MTGQEIADARDDLGILWGLGRALYAAELGRVLELPGRDPGRQVLRWETGVNRIPGPVACAIYLMMTGAKPRALARMADA